MAYKYVLSKLPTDIANIVVEYYRDKKVEDIEHKYILLLKMMIGEDSINSTNSTNLTKQHHCSLQTFQKYCSICLHIKDARHNHNDRNHLTYIYNIHYTDVYDKPITLCLFRKVLLKMEMYKEWYGIQ